MEMWGPSLLCNSLRQGLAAHLSEFHTTGVVIELSAIADVAAGFQRSWRVLRWKIGYVQANHHRLIGTGVDKPILCDLLVFNDKSHAKIIPMVCGRQDRRWRPSRHDRAMENLKLL